METFRQLVDEKYNVEEPGLDVLCTIAKKCFDADAPSKSMFEREVRTTSYDFGEWLDGISDLFCDAIPESGNKTGIFGETMCDMPRIKLYCTHSTMSTYHIVPILFNGT